MARINARQFIFIQSYLDGNTAKQAAIDAGYSVDNAASQGVNLLKKPHIALEIARKKEELSNKAQFTREEFLQELAETIKEAKSHGAKVQAMRLYADTVGWTSHDTKGTLDVNIQLIDKFEVKGELRGPSRALLAEAETVDLEEEGEPAE